MSALSGHSCVASILSFRVAPWPTNWDRYFAAFRARDRHGQVLASGNFTAHTVADGIQCKGTACTSAAAHAQQHPAAVPRQDQLLHSLQIAEVRLDYLQQVQEHQQQLHQQQQETRQQQAAQSQQQAAVQKSTAMHAVLSDQPNLFHDETNLKINQQFNSAENPTDAEITVE